MSRSLLAWNYILIDGIFKLEGGGGRIILLEEKEQPEKCTQKNIYIFLKWFEIVSKKKKKGAGFMVFNTTWNNISFISWQTRKK